MDRKKELLLLKEAGLTDYEAIAYLTLIDNPDLTAVEVNHKASIPLQRVYDTLESLVEKGFTTVGRGRPKVFEARPPSSAWKSYISFKREAFAQERRRLEGIGKMLLGELELSYWQPRMKVKAEELMMLLPSLKAAEEETVRLIEGAQETIKILTATFDWYDRVEQALRRRLHVGAECFVIFSTRNVENGGSLEGLLEMGCKVRVNSKPWFPLRETIVDDESVVFVIWASEDKRTFWHPIAFRPHFSRHPAIVKVFSDSFSSLWDQASEV